MRRFLFAVLVAVPVSPAMAGDGESSCAWLEPAVWWIDAPGMNYGALAAQSSGYQPVLSWLLCSAPGSGDTERYWRVSANALGSGQHELSIEAGVYGRYRVWAGQRQIATAVTSIETPFVNAGSAHLRLPGDWQAATTTAGMGRLLPSLRAAQLGTTRRSSEIGVRWQWPGTWYSELRYRQDDMQGLSSMAGVIGTGGGNSRAILLPTPVDSTTRQFDLLIGSAGPVWQWQGSVLLSQFDNALTALRWQNPFATVAGWSGGAGFPGEGQLQTPPDNRYLRLGMALGYSFSERTRFSADLGVGRATQHQPFLPYSVNPLAMATVVQPLPRSQFDGRIDSTTLRLRLHSQASVAWRWSVDYRLDDRDNRSPQDEYVVIVGDAQAQNAAATSATRRYNLTDDYREQRAQAELGYRPSRRIDLSVALSEQRVDRSASARNHSDEQQWRLNLRARPSDRISAGVRWQDGRRRGGSYLGSQPFLESHSPGYTDTVPGGWENLPGLRQFHLADRDREQATLYVDVQPMPGMNIGWRGSRSTDDYRASEFGLQHSRLQDHHLEVSYGKAAWSVSAFAGRERARFLQDGRAFQGGANRVPQSNDPNRDWRAEHDDRVRIWGLSLRRDWSGRGSASLDYVRSRVDGLIDVQVGPALSAAPLPPTRADLATLELRGDWPLTSALDLRLAWRWERFVAADFTRDGIGVNTLANVILLGEDSPDYRIGAWLLALRYRF